MIIGVTATRSGMTPKQAETFARLLAALPVTEIRHGDCVGGDADCDAMAASLGITRIVHPPDNAKLRAHCRPEAGGGAVLPPKPYKERNKDIVWAADVMFAVPSTFKEQQYGGTWGTVRVTRHARKPLVVIYPDGSISEERTSDGCKEFSRVLSHPQ